MERHRLRMGGIAAVLCVLLSGAAAMAADRARPVLPELMLATQHHAGVDVPAYWVSEKLDGVRARWDGQRLWTRGGYAIGAPAWFTAGWPREPLDGELWIGRGRFEDVSALVATHEAADARWRMVRFMAFDLPRQAGGFEARLSRMRALVDATDNPSLALVVQRRLSDRTALEQWLQTVVAQGGEGLMLHHRDARYIAGRSTGLLKFKAHDDADAKVVAYRPGKGKYAGMVGALVVEREDGVRFRLGSGLSDLQRTDPPALGALVTYRYNGLTVHGLPRFARFLRVRTDDPGRPAGQAEPGPSTR